MYTNIILKFRRRRPVAGVGCVEIVETGYGRCRIIGKLPIDDDLVVPAVALGEAAARNYTERCEAPSRDRLTLDEA